MDAHKLSLVLRAGAGLLVLALAVHYWPSRASGFANDNIFMTATLVMCTVSVFLADPLVEDDGPRILLKTVGFLGLAGLGAAAFLF